MRRIQFWREMTFNWIKQEDNLQRSLQRLRQTIQTRSVEELLPAFSYTATLMDELLQAEERDMKANYYILIFDKLIGQFKAKLREIEQKKLKLSHNRSIILSNVLEHLQKYEKANQINEFRQKTEIKEHHIAFMDIFKKVEQYYQDHNLDEAQRQIGKLTQMKKQYPQLMITEHMQAKIAKINQQYLKMQTFYSYFDQPDWIFDKEEDNIRLQYKVLEEERTIVVRILAEVDIEIMPFLAIASEIDFQKEYVPFVYVSEEVKALARNRKAGYSKTYVPLLTDRQCYFSAVGYDRIATTGSIFLFTQSYDQDYELQKEFQLYVPSPQQSDYVRLKVHYFCLEYKPLTKKRAQIRLVTKADFRLSFLPLWILQKSARYFTFNYFQSIVDKAKHFQGSIWEKRVAENPSMYNFFQKKIDEYLL